MFLSHVWIDYVWLIGTAWLTNKGTNLVGTQGYHVLTYVFEVPDYGSPITILEGTKDKEAIEFAARLTARYSDADTSQVLVEYGRNKEEKILVKPD